MNLTMTRILVALLAMLATFQASASDLPNSSLTPGAIDSNVTQQNIQSTVCVKGYTKTVRPPASYTNKLKKRQIRQYSYGDQNPKHYEEDHLIPLSIGGNPTDPANLWPEPRLSEWSAAKKDDLEFTLYKMMCNDQIGLKEAQAEISSDWIVAYNKYVHEGKRRRHGQRFGRVE